MPTPLLISKVDMLLGDASSGYRVEPRDISIRDGRFSEIAPAGTLRPEEDWHSIDGGRRLAVPGLINAHGHTTSSVMRGTTDGLDHVSFMWTNQADTLGRTPDEIYAATVWACLDMLRHGITAAIDHVPEQNARLDLVEPVARAFRDTGMRGVLALRIFDGAYDDIIEELSPDDARALMDANPLKPVPAPDLLALCEQAARNWHDPERLLSVFPAPSNPLRCSDELLAGCEALAARLDLGVHTHLLETKVQADLAQKAYGCTMVAHMDEIGAFSSRWSLAHGVWIDPEDDAALAARGAIVVHNPHSNAKIAAGTAPIARLKSNGVRLALGTDGASTNDTLSVHETMALAVLLARTGGAAREDWIMTEDALAMATTGGAAALLAADDLGAIETGRRADLALYDLDDFALLPLNDAVQQLVFSERGRAVKTTIVDGRIVYEDGKFAWGDTAELRETVLAMRARQMLANPALRRLAD